MSDESEQITFQDYTSDRGTAGGSDLPGDLDVSPQELRDRERQRREALQRADRREVEGKIIDEDAPLDVSEDLDDVGNVPRNLRQRKSRKVGVPIQQGGTDTSSTTWVEVTPEEEEERLSKVIRETDPRTPSMADEIDANVRQAGGTLPEGSDSVSEDPEGRGFARDFRDRFVSESERRSAVRSGGYFARDDPRERGPTQVSETLDPVFEGAAEGSDMNAGQLRDLNVLSQDLDTEVEAQTDDQRAWVSAGDYLKAVRAHRDRSATAQRVDERRSAPTASSFEAWQRAPSRRDFPGVDSNPDRDEVFGTERMSGGTTGAEVLSAIGERVAQADREVRETFDLG